MNLIVDIGNTRAKLWLFEAGEPKAYACHRHFDKALQEILATGKPERCAVSTVGLPFADVSETLSPYGIKALEIKGSTPTSLQMAYQTPHTLGADRLAAAVGAWELRPETPLLVVDAGTCVTFDFVDAEGSYHGGNISLGASARLAAMHALTARLPLVSKEGEVPLLGCDTPTAIRSGVINALRYELRGYINDLKTKHPRLHTVLTGGDAELLSTGLTEEHTIDQDLVARGINCILLYNDTL